MKYFLSLTIFMFIGCTGKETPVCVVGKTISEVVASEVAVQLQCKNKQAIVDDMFKQLETWKVCEPAMQSVIGDLICPRLVGELIDGAFRQIPTKWECDGTALKDSAKSQLIALCRGAI